MGELAAFVVDSVPTLEILNADAETSHVRANQHCGLDRPEAGAPGVAPAGEPECGEVRSGHRDAAKVCGRRQIARFRAGQHCGLDRLGTDVLGGRPGWRVGALKCPTGTQGRRGGRWRESERVLAGAGHSAAGAPVCRSWRDER
ncbi:hypothetical protein NDU88_004424 [Pleurodeles waltl]|uniref:Uncharacterized protein n=1 Tax=Pleurodeles waltl TaxID=8319 RepID=A0AAV7NJR2_PLEWA|nr:hypothetical protein NDU88_004424 [Pleurodeles waltl]